MITESDWKKFKKIKEKALEKYCAETLVECERVITGKGPSNYDRYITLYELVKRSDKKLGAIFDGLSRSRAHPQLMLMRSEGLVEEADLSSLSEGFQASTQPPNWD